MSLYSLMRMRVCRGFDTINQVDAKLCTPAASENDLVQSASQADTAGCSEILSKVKVTSHSSATPPKTPAAARGCASLIFRNATTTLTSISSSTETHPHDQTEQNLCIRKSKTPPCKNSPTMRINPKTHKEVNSHPKQYPILINHTYRKLTKRVAHVRTENRMLRRRA